MRLRVMGIACCELKYYRTAVVCYGRGKTVCDPILELQLRLLSLRILSLQCCLQMLPLDDDPILASSGLPCHTNIGVEA